MNDIMTVGSLFTGIGMFDLGFERAGMKCLWQVEKDDYATKILERHWPNVTRYRNVTEVGKHNLSPVDVLCGGFPCTDISIAGAVARERKMLEGDDSRLVYEFARIAKEMQPTWIVIENVNGVQAVFPELIKLFKEYHLYDTKYKANVPGAYTRRTRIFIVGHLRTYGRPGIFDYGQISKAQYRSGGSQDTLPMCLPWSGGLNFERLGSCVLHNPQTYPVRVRKSNGNSRQLDTDRWRVIGKSLVPQISEWIGRRIVDCV